MTSNDIVLKVESLSKVYRLGEVGTGTISHDLNRWFAKIRGKEDPFSKVGSINDRTQAAKKGEFIKALSDINFEVKKGEVLGIIGKNGAGKSTLLKVISQITAPTSGSIKAKGRVASLLEVGTGMHPEMTGKENVYLNGTILGMTRREIDTKFDEIMDFAGCTRYADTPVKRYSSGMKVRLGFAVAAFLEPEILIVDEVLAVGDAEFQKKAIGKMQDISAGGERTVLFVSHNMASVQSICNSSLLMQNGLVKEFGVTKEIIQCYLNQAKDVSKIDVKSRIDRSGNQVLKISEIEFIDAITKSSLDVVLSGQDIVIRLKYELNRNTEIKDLRVAIAFSSISGDEKFVVDNKYVGKNLSAVRTEGEVFCRIKKWPLNVGEYTFRIHIESKGDLLDRIENAGTINVEFGDFFGTGFKVPSHLNGALIEHEWY